MTRALELAAQADYRTSPNPMVGAVVLDATAEVVGEGFHERAGLPHAEAQALARSGERARGGTVYVNLEPCSHFGRTPPCVHVLIEAGVKRVVVAMPDPDERNRGRGIELLRGAGLDVEVGLAEKEATRLNEFFIKHRTTGRPFVSAKFAVSLDGKIATSTGDSKWITGEEARAHGHVLRHRHDAILVGVNTVLADDPDLTARFEGARQPLRIVLDGTGRTPANARVRGAGTLFDAGRALPDLLEQLARRGVLSLLVEGGARVHGSFFDQSLVDKVYAYISPTVIGGARAPGPVAGRGAEHLADALRLVDVESTVLGRDLLVTGYVDRRR